MSGIWWEGHKCPKCGATLLKSGKGNIWCSLVGCDYSRHMTNFDRITASPDALASEIAKYPHHCYPWCIHHDYCVKADCFEGIRDWLNQEAEVE